MVDWATIGLGLGGNTGDAIATIEAALGLLREHARIRIERVSSMYRTAPWGPVVQPDFANACALGTTDLAPADLLREVKTAEARLGRRSGQRWGPRAIDIDILFYAGHVVDTADLVIPHESLFQRAFVLVPLAEIAPDLEIAGRRIGDARDAIDVSSVALWNAGGESSCTKI